MITFNVKIYEIYITILKKLLSVLGQFKRLTLRWDFKTLNFKIRRKNPK